MPDRYTVRCDGEVVLEIVDEPGALVSLSAGPPPPGSTSPPHAFLSGTAYVVTEEHSLRQILLASSSTADYIERLRAKGYEVVEKPPPGAAPAPSSGPEPAPRRGLGRLFGRHSG